MRARPCDILNYNSAAALIHVAPVTLSLHIWGEQLGDRCRAVVITVCFTLEEVIAYHSIVFMLCTLDKAHPPDGPPKTGLKAYTSRTPPVYSLP